MIRLIIEHGKEIPLLVVKQLKVDVALIVSKQFDNELVEPVLEEGTGLAIMVEYSAQNHGYGSKRDHDCTLAVSDCIRGYKNDLSSHVDMVPIQVSPIDQTVETPAHINTVFTY